MEVVMLLKKTESTLRMLQKPSKTCSKLLTTIINPVNNTQIIK